MTHPHDLLAEFVDGAALSEEERLAVDAHLRSCAECRDELELARASSAALGALEDEPVPDGLTKSVLDRIRDEPAASNGIPRWYRAAGLAAAAVVVGLLALAIPRLTSDDGAVAPASSEAAGEDAATPAPADLGVERRSTDFTEETLRDLIASERATLQSEPDAAGDPANGSDEALRCVRTAFPPVRGQPVQLIQARFRGQEAYIGVFQAEPGSGPPSATAVAASSADCGLLSVATRA